MNASTTESSSAPPARLAPEAFAERARAIESEVGRVIVGQRDLVRQTLTGLLANSHHVGVELRENLLRRKRI